MTNEKNVWLAGNGKLLKSAPKGHTSYQTISLFVQFLIQLSSTPRKYYKFNFIDIQSKCILHIINNNNDNNNNNLCYIYRQHERCKPSVSIFLIFLLYLLIVVRNLRHRVFEHHNNAFLSRNASYVTQYFYRVEMWRDESKYAAQRPAVHIK